MIRRPPRSTHCISSAASDGIRDRHNSPRDSEEVVTLKVRFRTVGDAPITGAVESTAETYEDIVAEVAATRLTERGATRADDRLTEAAMEDRKKEGYF
jgi:sulfate adenylyltransferase subunit 2